MSESLYAYFAEELAALRRRGAELGRAHPRLAGRLGLAQEGSADPAMERLLQGFALLAARLHQRLDDQFADMADSLLDELYPHLVRPVPARGIVQLAAVGGTGAGPISPVMHVPAGTELAAAPFSGPASGALRGLACRFRTVYPTDVAPIEIVSTRLETVEPGLSDGASDVVSPKADARLLLRLRVVGEGGFGRLGLRHLRFHLDGDLRSTVRLYELLVGRSVAAWVRLRRPRPGGPRQPLHPVTVAPVGLEPSEAMLPGVPDSLHGYRLLLEHFTFPAKFLFLDIRDLPRSLGPDEAGQEIEIGIELASGNMRRGLELFSRSLGPMPLRLGCTPVVNLFACEADPIRLTHETVEEPVVVDQRRPGGFEVYSIESVALVGREGRLGRQEIPRIHERHRRAPAWQKASPELEEIYWAARRSDGPGGRELLLTVLDHHMSIATPSDGVLLPRVLATNGDVPASLPARPDRDLTLEGFSGVTAHRLAPYQPSVRLAPGGAARWRLVGHLVANRRTLSDGDGAALRELLGVYNLPEEAEDQQLALEISQQIGAIAGVTSRTLVQPLGDALDRSLVRGVEIQLAIDEAALDTGSGFLLATVLDRFFASFAAVNSFTRLVTVSPAARREPLHEWPARIGLRPLV